MRFGVVTTSYPRSPGDPAGNFVAGFCHWLARQGHDVEVIAAGETGGAQTDGHVTVHRVRCGGRLFYGGRGAPERLGTSPRAYGAAALFAGALTRAVARHAGHWDHIVSHWLAPSGLAVALAARAHSHLAVAHSGDVHLLARPLVADAAVSTLLASRTRIAFVGQHLREKLLCAVRSRMRRERLTKMSFVCPMGIDVASFARAGKIDRGGARQRIGVPRSATVIAYLGRLVPIKGVHVLLEAVAQMQDDIHLVVGGDGIEAPVLKDKASQLGVHVTFLGEVKGAKRQTLFAAADTVALPSVETASGRTEGAPVVALETMAAGVPLVASNTGALRDITHGAARLTAPGNAGELASALSAALHESNTVRINKGHAVAEAHDWSQVGPRLLDGSRKVSRSSAVGYRDRSLRD